jgi:hypothetical protein
LAELFLQVALAVAVRLRLVFVYAKQLGDLLPVELIEWLEYSTYQLEK